MLTLKHKSNLAQIEISDAKPINCNNKKHLNHLNALTEVKQKTVLL